MLRVGVELIPYSWKLKLFKIKLTMKWTFQYGKIPKPFKDYLSRL